VFLTLYIDLQVSQNVNRRPIKLHIPSVLELSFLSVTLMVAMRVCSAGVPLDTVGVCQRMERNGLELELEEHPAVTSAKVC